MRLKRICKHAWKRLVAMTLVIAMLNTSVGPVSVQAEDTGETGVDDPQTVTLYTDDANGNTGNTDGNEEPGEESGDAADTSGSAGDTETKEQENVPAEQNVYDSGLIRIYNLEQLEAVGTGAQVYSGDDSADTFGTGDAVTDENGSAVVYGNDAAYMLMNEISLDSSDLWQLPAGFAGSFTGTGGNAGSPLYDAETDTIYIYNNYQLGTANDPEALKTVMSNDMIAEEFGMGQIVFADEAEETQLEYTDAHNYVLTTDFTSEMPELKAAEVQDEVSVQLGGREFIGQSAMKIDGETYILIGNEKQLRAIGDDVAVVPMYFARNRVSGTKYKLKPYYPGDADLNITTLSDAGIEEDKITWTDYVGYRINGIEGETFEHHTDLLNDSSIGDSVTHADSTKYVISIDENGDKKLTADSESNEKYIKLYKDLKYTTEANYIIFRDIDLLSAGENSDGEDNLWEPLMFSGNMIGSVNMAGIDVETGTIDESKIAPVTISNITVRKEGEIDPEKGIQGAGFFGTIGSLPGEDDNILGSKGTVSVTGLNLKNVDVSNTSVSVENDHGLLDTLLAAVTGFLTPLLWILDIDISALPEMLWNGLNGNDSMYAAGSFAGTVSGDVKVANCSVENAKVQNEADRTGGFIGDIQGKTLYTLQGQRVSLVIKAVTGILQAIPLLGLGNVVDVLLNGGLIDLTQLIPVGYAAPTITDCRLINVNQETLGSAQTSFNGGFAGRIEGGVLQNITVTQNKNLTVTGNKFVGGFAGSIANTEVKGLLTNIDIDILNSIFSQSIVAGVSVSGQGTISVTATDKDPEHITDGNTAAYTGGFTGYIASSYVIECRITNLAEVNSPGSYVGGFAGYTSPGASLSVGKEYTGEERSALLTAVLEFLKKVLGGESAEYTPLLSLVGVSPAYIYGCEASGLTGAEITGKDYVGGGVCRKSRWREIWRIKSRRPLTARSD